MEMENNVMFEEINYEETTPVEVETEESGLSGAAFMAIGALGAAAIGAAVTFGKKLWKKHKDKKELRKPDEETPVELSDEDIAEITAE